MAICQYLTLLLQIFETKFFTAKIVYEKLTLNWGLLKQGWKLCRAKRYVVTCMKGYHIYNSMVRAQTRYVHIPRYVLGRNCIKQISMNVVRAGTLGEKP